MKEKVGGDIKSEAKKERKEKMKRVRKKHRRIRKNGGNGRIRGLRKKIERCL